MSKRLKTVLLICALFCLSLFGAVFAACTPPEDQPGHEPSTKTYSVTVTDTDGGTLSGVMVQMCVVTEEGGTGLSRTTFARPDSVDPTWHSTEDGALTRMLTGYAKKRRIAEVGTPDRL